MVPPHQISPAERVRLVHTLLTAPIQGESDLHKRGAEILPRSHAFPHVVDMMPLHDVPFNRSWISAWSRVSLKSIIYGITDYDVERLREHFGENIALYFAFLNTYFQALAPAMTLGLFFWACGRSYNPVYAVLLVLWACTFVEVWRLRERKLAVRWGMSGVANVSERCPTFRPSVITRDLVTGERREIFPWWRRDLRVLLMLPVTLLFIAVLVVMLTALFVIEVLAGEIYDGPGKQFVPFIPTVLYSTCIPLILSAWGATARLLTRLENHATVRVNRASYTIKLFGMQSIVTYGGLILTVFLYIPFGELLVRDMWKRGYLTALFRMILQKPDFTMSKKHNFRVSPERLQNQLFAVCVTGQVMNTVFETLMPIAIRAITRAMGQLMKRFGLEHKTGQEKRRVSFAGDQSERSFLERVNKEFMLPEYDTFVDYAEMATQFGNISLWSSIWPLAPVMGFVNNWFELRSDALKLAINMRRPVPQRCETIGSWLQVLAFTVRFAVFMNAALIYLFEDQLVLKDGGMVMHTVLRSSIHPDVSADAVRTGIASMLPQMLPRSGPAGALAAAFLFALVAEQIFSVARSFVRHILQRCMWNGSEEEIIVRRHQFQSRQSLVGRLPELNDLDYGTKSGQQELANSPFWHPSRDSGMSSLVKAGKEA